MDSSPVGGLDNLSKKRAAFCQLTKDDDPDEEEENIQPTIETGTFKRASDDVIASRRIVKVRRTSSPPHAAPNPFASISLVPPSNLNLKADTPPALTGSEELSANERKDATHGDVGKDQNGAKDRLLHENQNLQASNSVEAQVDAGNLAGGSHETTTGQLESTPKTEDAAGNGETEAIQPGENVGNDLTDSNRKAELSTGKEESPTVSLSFQQHSTGKNAFSGSFGTGFPKSSFSFGITSSPFSSPVGFGSFGSSSSLGSTPFGSSLSTEGGLPLFFGKNNTGAVAPFQLFGSQDEPAAPANSGQLTQATVSLSEVPVETGEEKEKAVFAADATLFEFVDKAWKERGKGEIRVNLSEDADHKARLVMRSKGNLRLLLNASLFPDMRMNKMDNRSVTFACANSASTLNIGGLTTYALKLKDGSTSANFMAVVDAHKLSSSQTETQKSTPGAPEKNEDLTKEVQNTTDKSVEATNEAGSQV